MQATFRPAHGRDVDAILRFGYAVVPSYFTPLLGEEVARWRLAEWTRHGMESAIGRARVHVAVTDDVVLGVSETGTLAGEEVLWKLYLAPDARDHGMGSELLGHSIASLPETSDHLLVGHFAGNLGAARFFERAGFRVTGGEPPLFGGPESAMVWRRLDLDRATHRHATPAARFNA